MTSRSFMTPACFAIAACAACSNGEPDRSGTVDRDAGPLAFVDGSRLDPLDDPTTPVPTRIEQLFRSARCAGGAETHCHGSGAADLHLSLTGATDLIGVPATQRADMMRVTPFDPDASYLYWKVRADAGIDGDVMPRDRGYDARIDRLVFEWIEAGAPRP